MGGRRDAPFAGGRGEGVHLLQLLVTRCLRLALAARLHKQSPTISPPAVSIHAFNGPAPFILASGPRM